MDSKNKELKCPQCGANCCCCSMGDDDVWDRWIVHCQECSLQLINRYHTREMAIEAWLSKDTVLKMGWDVKNEAE